MRILTERRLENATADRLTERVVYFDNGCVVRQVMDAKGEATEKEILLRLVYANDEVTETILNALRNKYTGC